MAILQGFAKHRGRREGLGEGKGCAKTWVRLPFQPPHIYRGKGERGRPPQIQSKEGAAARGGCLAPQGKGGAPPLGFPQTLGAWTLGGRRPAH